MAKIRRNADGTIGLGRNKSWAERQASAPQKPKKSQKPSKGKYARNTKDATERAKRAKGRQNVLEDSYTRGKRIRDIGQAVPKGYMRTGGRYFAKVANMRPITSKTTDAQRMLFYANRPKFLGPKDDGGWMRSIGNQGMYNGSTSEANFRKTSAARKLIDADGGTYGPKYGKAGKKTRSKSRYIMAIGQDGHVR